MGENEKRDKFVMIKVSEDEKRKMILAARKNGMTLSCYVRWALLAEKKE